MKLIENKVEECTQSAGIDGIYEAVRSAAAICYQTDIAKMSLMPKEFVEQVLLKNGHTRPLEFGTVYLRIPSKDASHWGIDHKHKTNKLFLYMHNPYSKVTNGFDNNHQEYYITTNMRVIMQGYYSTDKEAFDNGYDQNWLDDLRYLCDPTPKHEKRYTFNIILSRGGSDDFRTHITLSSICESTRFCNYSKGKFGKELTFIRPYWISQEVVSKYFDDDMVKNYSDYMIEFSFLDSMKKEENNYMAQSLNNLQPQQLKRLYPLGAKCELRLCGFEDAWLNFLWRRNDGHADPECQYIAKLIQEKLTQYGKEENCNTAY